jgi:transcriptional regulator with XRE-family HTH domain
MNRRGPSDWNKAVTVARYRLCGMSQTEVAGITGVSSATISNWEASMWWSDALLEASTIEFSHLAAKALGVIKQKLDEGDAATARWFLSKAHPILADKPRQSLPARVEVKSLPDLAAMSDEELRSLANGDGFIYDVQSEDEYNDE